ncbi:hypothetical protein P154DRAFT_544679 [Amniculicola lignicola CBS 123094]|uniref:Uncharacterized protein n=1 Tax=Amniculicola lignicola CBS 123094 TaxID=1392246 RepID=A0A6A5WJL6_9PLEO|nr:hypothetical protein P154DRAFT_544679 [Amniculicola lignicola CBS 123094]
MASTIQAKIQSASAKNAQLLSALHETDSAPSQLYQQIQYINDLDSQIQRTAKGVNDLRKKTASELEDHKKYSESTFRRFAHKASGRKDRFEEKAAKEEREYFDAIQQQKTGEDQLAYTRQLKSEAEITKQQYEAAAQRHAFLQEELDALYNSIFAGHTPGFPIEDARESEYVSAVQHHLAVGQTLEKEKHVLFLLRQIQHKLGEARSQLSMARSASQMDMFSSGGTLISMQKRNYLERAESCISQVRMLQNQVRQIHPDVAELGQMNIASGSIWSDVVFDNIFTDMKMHDMIKESEMQTEQVSRKLFERLSTQASKVETVEKDLKTSSEGLNQARRALQTARERAFAGLDQGVEDSEHSDAPPAYTA